MTNVKIEYKRGENYKIFPITGALGSLNPQGLLICDFYLDRVITPNATTISIDESNNKVTEKHSRSKNKNLDRELLVGIAVHPEIARSIGEWLIKKADEFQKSIKNPNE